MFADLILIFFLGLSAGSLMSILMMLFPNNLKFIGIAIGFNVSMTIFGSLTPLTAVWLLKKFSSPTAPFLCLVTASLITLTGIKFFESHTTKLEKLNSMESEKVAYDS